MSSVLPVIVARLASALPDATVVGGRAPDTPDELLLVRSSPAGSPTYLNASGRAAIEYHAIQVLARALAIDDAEALAWSAYHALPARHLEDTGGRIDWLTANHAPAHVGFDQNDRAIVSVNFTLQRWGYLTEEEDE